MVYVVIYSVAFSEYAFASFMIYVVIYSVVRGGDLISSECSLSLSLSLGVTLALEKFMFPIFKVGNQN